MISISMTTGNSAGNVVINKTSLCKMGELSARVSRQATLDGGAVIVHSGVSDSDRTLHIEAPITKEQKTTLEYIHRNSTSVLVGCSEGLFLGSISFMDMSTKILKAKILIESKENS